MEKQLLKLCEKAQKNKKLNPMMRNLFCEDLVSNYKEGTMNKNELKWTIDWYKKALKDGDFDWNEYNQHHKKSKRTNRRRTNRRKTKRRRTNRRRTKSQRRTNRRRTKAQRRTKKGGTSSLLAFDS
tara:strand:+ start:866 stop:1243 length:378 start_codon:yes stop_codon:yes gene_type:complete